MSIVQDPIYFNKLYRQALEAYIQDTWWPAVKKDPREYDYWRVTLQKRRQVLSYPSEHSSGHGEGSQADTETAEGRRTRLRTLHSQ